MHKIEDSLRRYRLSLCAAFAVILAIIVYRSSQSILDNLVSNLLWAAATLLLGALVVPLRGYFTTARAEAVFGHYASSDDFPRGERQAKDAVASQGLVNELFERARAVDADHARIRPVEAALLMCAIQDYDFWSGKDPQISISNFMKLADRATGYKPYRVLLLSRSLKQLFGDRAADMAEEIERKGEFSPVNISNTRVDTETLERIAPNGTEVLYNVSVTSQETNLGVMNLKRAAASRIELVNFLVSPLSLTDSALSSLDEEYDIPPSLYPRDQFVSDRLIDRVRRVGRIMGAIASAGHANGGELAIRQLLCTRSYPGVRVRLLAASGTLQIRVSGLRYPNNLYRFGYSTDSAAIVSEFLTALNRFQANESLCREVALSPGSIALLLEQATLECFRSLLSSGASWSDVARHKANIVRTAKSPETVKLLDALEILFADHDGLSGVRAAGGAVSEHSRYGVRKGTPSDEAVLTVPGRAAHVSAGILFESHGKLLMIRKKRAPHEGLFSIIAGHVKAGESAVEAARREAMEEIGFAPSSLWLEALVDNVAEDTCTLGESGHRWYVFSCNDLLEADKIQLSEVEAHDFLWVARDDIPSLELTPGCRRVLLATGRL